MLQNAFNNCNLNGCYLNGAMCLFSVCNRLRRVPASVSIQTCNQTRLNNNYLIPLCQMTISLCYPFATTCCALNVFFKTTTWKIDKNNFEDLNFEVISLWKNLSLKQLLNCLFNLYECVTILDFFLFLKKHSMTYNCHILTLSYLNSSKMSDWIQKMFFSRIRSIFF